MHLRPAATVSGYANNPLCLDGTEFSAFNTLREHKAFWILLLHQGWRRAYVPACVGLCSQVPGCISLSHQGY